MGEGAAGRRDGDFAEAVLEVRPEHGTEGTSVELLSQTKDGAKSGNRGHNSQQDARSSSEMLCRGCFAESSPPPRHLSPEEGDVGLCPALHWSSWEVPSLCTWGC